MSKNMDNQVRYFNKYICDIFSGQPEYDFTNKTKCINQHMLYMFNRTQSMFEWVDLPDTIPQRSLELYLQINGNVCFYEFNNKLYVFNGGLGGKPNVYYMPTIYTIANPALNISKNLKIDEECIVIPNDSLYIGLLPMFARYASGMTENELSMRIATINSRIIQFISAPDDRTRLSAEKFLQDIISGKLGVIAENGFLDGVRVHTCGTTGNSDIITKLIELEQYLKASWYNELGLNANYNMKRESINSGESQLNDDALLPLVDDMLSCRQRGAAKVNEMFGTNISVKLNSSWELSNQESELSEQTELKNNSGQPEIKGDELNDGVETVE